MKALNLSFRRKFYFAFYLLLTCNSFQSLAQERSNSKTFSFYYSRSQDKALGLETRKRLLEMAGREVHKMKDDSLKYWHLSKIVVAADVLDDTLLFNNNSSEAIKLANTLNKPNKLGDAYWNYGAFLMKRQVYDSSYFYNKAYKIFTSIDHYYYSGKMLYNMALLSSHVNDYTGAEIHLFKAIGFFERDQKHKQLYLSFNLLGTIAENLGEFERAILYYNRAAGLIPKIENSNLEQIENWNNIGLIYQRLENYDKAINYFDKGISQWKTKDKRPSLYAKLLDNKAFSIFLMDRPEDIEIPMKTALAIRDSIFDTAGLVVNRIHLAKYYAKQGDTTEAIQNAKTAFEMAYHNQLSRDILQSLELLAIIDVDNKTRYLEQHITLDKQLNTRERSIRNKFAAIRYDTENYIIENDRLFKERSWILASAIGLMFILLLIYWNTRQKARNKELLFEQEQQQYNEDMYLLALENKTTLERGRSEERIRISQELHDGILAKLFSVRFKWGYLDLRGAPENLNEHKKSIEQLTDIETEIRNISHDLRNEIIWNEIEFINEIENAIREKSELSKFKYSFEWGNSTDWQELDYIIKINISRMLDEMLHNIIKHAKASEVNVAFKKVENEFIISVIDNGKGFGFYLKRGIGIKNLKNRTKKINGELNIKSGIGLGTSIEITFKKVLNDGN